MSQTRRGFLGRLGGTVVGAVMPIIGTNPPRSGAKPPRASSLAVDGAITYSVGPTMYNVKSFGATGDGVAFDSTAIQLAMDTAGLAGGGVVGAPVGTFILNAPLVFHYDNVYLVGSGPGTIFKAKASLNADLITTPTVGGPRRLVGVQNMTLTAGTRASQTAGNGIRVYQCLNGLFSNLNILNLFDYAIVTDGIVGDSYGNRWDHINIAGCGGGVRGAAAEDERFIDIMIHDAVAGYSEMTLAGGQHHVAFCTFAGGGTYDRPTLVLANNGGSRIENNRFDTTRNQAIYTIGNNQIIIGNDFLNPNYPGASWAVIQLTSSNNTVMGNHIYMDPVHAATYQYGIYEDPAVGNNLIADNWILPGTSSAITPGLKAGSPSIIRNNKGYNPVGSVSTPGFPATNVAVSNNVGVDVVAYITNGTNPLMVQVDAVTSLMVIPANQAGTVRIPHGSTFTPTFGGGSPTWKWYGE